MNRFKTYGLVGLCGIGVVATIDSAFGLGGSALLADICMTILEGAPQDGEMAAMDDMDMEVKPVPLIALSLAATTAAIIALAKDHQRIAMGRAEPDDKERASILSAMLVVAAVSGRTTREEMMDVFRIVTGHGLNDELLDLAYARFATLSQEGAMRSRLPPVSSSIGRRRTLAAAMMIGCVVRPATGNVQRVLDRLAQDIGADANDVSEARQALDNWQEDCTPCHGVSPVTLLRHRPLTLMPA
ncbi:MAG: hypothetical protein AAF718_06820 [Pseudomonadota bacterium]